MKKTPLAHGGGYLLANGCYTVMFAQYVFGEERPERIGASGQRNENGVYLAGQLISILSYDQDTPLGIDICANIVLEYSGGRSAHLFYHGQQATPCKASVSGPNGQLLVGVNTH